VTALPPGNRKTAVFADTTRPLEQYEQSESQRLSREIAKTQSLYKIREAALKRAQDEAARAKPQEQQRLAEVAAQMAAELTALKIPCPPRYVADDCTPERLATILRDQGGRIAVMSPEGDVFDLMAGRYSANGTSNFGVYLKGHAGDTLRVDRVGRPPDFVKAPALTVGLAVQPEVLRGLVEKPGFRGRGLLGRFQYSLPKSLLGNRITNAPPVPDDVRATYHKNVLALLEVPLGTDEDGSNVLNLEPVAQECLQHFDAWLEPQLAEFGELGGVTDWAGKLVGTIGRLAGILHVAAFAGESTPWEIPVSPQTVEHAIAIGRYLIPHAKAAYAEMGADAVVEQAKRILRWIEHGGLSRFTKRDVHQGMRGRFKRTEELDAPLTLLIDHGYVRKRPQPKHDGPGRPPSPVFEVNPLWTTQNTQNLQNTPSDQNFEDCEDCEKAAVDLGLARVQTSGVEEGLAEDAGELE
jgi:replicative DNA helicase